jgi:hypothetical protein
MRRRAPDRSQSRHRRLEDLVDPRPRDRLGHEARARGGARDTRTRYRGAPADIESPPRLIEVKAVGKASCRGDTLWLETRQVEEARANRNFYVYLVENVRQGDRRGFALKVFGGERLARLIARAKERRYLEVPLPVADYEAATDQP